MCSKAFLEDEGGAGVSFVARQQLQNVNMRGLGHCAPQTHRDSTAVSKCIEERASRPVINPLSFFSSLETFHKKKMRRKYIEARNKRN